MVRAMHLRAPRTVGALTRTSIGGLSTNGGEGWAVSLVIEQRRQAPGLVERGQQTAGPRCRSDIRTLDPHRPCPRDRPQMDASGGRVPPRTPQAVQGKHGGPPEIRSGLGLHPEAEASKHRGHETPAIVSL